MASLIGFDANTVEPNSFQPIPNGWYHAIITESEMKPTQNGNGSYLKMKFVVTDGEYKNRSLFTNLNLNNQNADTVRIARGTLSAICRAVNVMTPNDSCDLHNIPLCILVSCKKDNNGEIRNDIKDFKEKSYMSTLSSGTSSSASSNASETAPWKR